MKKMKTLTALLLTAAFAFGLSAQAVQASDVRTIQTTEPYTYQVTLQSGEHGTFDSQKVATELAGFTLEGKSGANADATAEADFDTVRLNNLAGSEAISINPSAITAVQDVPDREINGVTVAGKEYYIKGFKVSGQDNVNIFATLTLAEGDMHASGDMDYVVAYGIMGDQVEYTVNYVNRSGKELYPSEVFYGNVGDKPIVMYRYIRGYAPDVKAFTQTLEKGQTYEFTFVYSRVPTIQNEYTYYDEEVVIDNGITNLGGGGNGAGAGAAAGTGGTTAEAAEDETAAGQESTEETGVPGLEPQEIVDLDDEEVPLGNLDLSGDGIGSGLTSAIYVSIGLLAAAILAAIYFISKRREKSEE